MKSRALRSATEKNIKKCTVQLKRIDKLIEKHKKMPVKKMGSATTASSSIMSKNFALKKVTTSAKKELISKNIVKTVAQEIQTGALGRSKRTPKPNRKYIDDSIKLIKTLESDDDSDLENDSNTSSSAEDSEEDTVRRTLRSSKTESVKQKTPEDKTAKRGPEGRPPLPKQATKRKIIDEDIPKELPQKKRVRRLQILNQGWKFAIN